MKLPFTTEQFLEVFRNYNQTVFPAQIILYLLAGLALYFSFKKPAPNSGKVIAAILAFFWLWMGIVYHLLFFTKINPAANVFGALFIVQGGLFFLYEFPKRRLSFSFRKDLRGWAGGALILFALVVYPVIGYFTGHVYPASPTFGLPCPTTIFTFGMLLWVERKPPVLVLVIPLLWSVVGFSAALTLGIMEDAGLLVSGLITAGLAFSERRKL
ncbi:MAG: DUF6064 family protein [Saprospiraceae bacterium]